MQLWRDGTHPPVKGRWFRADKGALVLSEMSYFRAAFTWLRGEANGPIGEQVNMPTVYDKGKNTLGLKGRSRCGSLEAITNGGRTGVDPVIVTAADGSSACCNAVSLYRGDSTNGPDGITYQGSAGLVDGHFGLLTPPFTAWLVLYRILGGADDIPDLPGWTINKAYRWTGSWQANLLVYRRDWPRTDDMPATFVSTAATLWTTGAIVYLPGSGWKLSATDAGEFPGLGPGTYEMHIPSLNIPSGGAILADLWLQDRFAALVSAHFPPWEQLNARFNTLFDIGYADALPAGPAPDYWQKRTSTSEYARRWWSGVFVR